MAKTKKNFIVQIDEVFCKGTEGCKICISFCPEGVLGDSEQLSLKGTHAAKVIDITLCTGCGLCMLYCPDLAIVVEEAEEVAQNV